MMMHASCYVQEQACLPPNNGVMVCDVLLSYQPAKQFIFTSNSSKTHTTINEFKENPF
jgi:hypothetical protein